MGRCQVTGKIVPEDELVEINGQRVCAEGKAILLERLQAGEVLPGEGERPGVLRRFGCSFLDGIILAVPSLGIGIVAGLMAAGAGAAGASGELSNIVTGLAQILAVAIGVAYFTFMHGTYGRSLGKMAGKLRVVRMDGQPMDMKTAFIRAMAYQGIQVLTGVLVMIHPTIGAVGSILFYIYAMVNVVVALMDRHMQRAIHDRIAGTRVIQLDK
jgi:uncharacterized RDD family membrane protein YckC